MPLDTTRTRNNAIGKLQAAGFNTTHPLFKGDVMVDAIVEAVIEEIIANGLVTTPVTGGSSAGSYPGTIS